MSDVTGTMAHSYVMAFREEIEAFKAFAQDFPKHAVLLIDTFDTEEGARRAVHVARELAVEGIELASVRLDSGDINSLARAVREILNRAGLEDTEIIASGDLDEYKIEELLSAGAPVDSFGVGTQLGTSGDEPSLGGVFELLAEDSEPKIKLSTGKVTLPGVKQIFRSSAGDRYDHDVIGVQDEDLQGKALLQPVMEKGHRATELEPLDRARSRSLDAIDHLSDGSRSLHERGTLEVRLSERLEALVDQALQADR